ncbi:MAG: ribonuclease T [Pseudomonadota bacterium]
MSNGTPISRRFRGFLPVVVDLETGGFNARTDAVLEIAAVMIEMDHHGRLRLGETITTHVEPFAGANIEPKSLEITGIDIHNPLRGAVSERAALDKVIKPVRNAVKHNGCSRAVLVGHNSFFDLNFLNAAVDRCDYKRNPFHAFSSFDTVTLAGLAYGQTVLARACEAAGLGWDNAKAHSAVYDAEQTARLFCKIVNQWDDDHPDRRLALFCS